MCFPELVTSNLTASLQAGDGSDIVVPVVAGVVVGVVFLVLSTIAVLGIVLLFRKKR